MKILALHRQQTAVGYYRTWMPARTLAKLGHEVTWWEGCNYITAMKGAPIDWLAKNGPYDLILTDRPLTEPELGWLTAARHEWPGCKLVVDFDDDFMAVPKWNEAYSSWQPGQLFYEVGLASLAAAELVTVSTERLKEKFKKWCHAVTVVPNRLDLRDWEGFPVDPERVKDPAVRVFYGGSPTHVMDVEEAKEGLLGFLRKPPCRVRFVCMGWVPDWLMEVAHEHRREMRVVCLPFHRFEDYPASVAWGGCDVAIAPLREHAFNEAKSNIKWLEAAAQGMAFLASDVGPYKRDVPGEGAVKVENTGTQWREALEALVTDRDLRERKVAKAGELVRAGWTIDQAGAVWEDVLGQVAQRPRIERQEDLLLPFQRP